MIFKIIILIILVIINGIFSASEMAFLNISKYELNKEIKKNNKKAKKVLEIINDESAFLSSIQIAITLSGFLASAFAAESFAGELANIIDISFMSEATLTSVLVILITIFLSYFTLVFGELVPKKIGLTYSKKIAFMFVDLMRIVNVIFKPFILVLTKSVDVVSCLFGIKDPVKDNENDIKESIIDSELEDFEKKLLFNVFEFNDITIKEVMTPSDKVIYIEINEAKDSVLKKIKKYKYTRIPVIKNDKVVGVLNMKDLIIKSDEEFNVKNYMRKISKLESNMIIDDAFLYLRSNHEMIAVVEEKNKYIGIVTIEDIIEEVVGNVFDEYD